MSITQRLLGKTETIKKKQTPSADVLGVTPYLPSLDKFKPVIPERTQGIGGYQEETSTPRPTRPSVLDTVRKELAQEQPLSYTERIKQKRDSILSTREKATQERLEPVREQAQQARVENVAETKASKIRQKAAELKLKSNQEELKNLMASSDRSKEREQRIVDLLKENTSLEGTARPFATGFTEAIPGLGGGLAPQTIEKAQEEKGYQAGKVGGTLASQATQYGVLGSALAGSAIGQRILGGAGASVGRQFVGKQATDLLVDTIVQTPREYFEGVKNDATLGEQAKNFAINRGLDILFNIAIGGISGDLTKAKEALKSPDVIKVMEARGLNPQDTLKALDTGNTQAIKDIQKTLNVDAYDVPDLPDLRFRMNANGTYEQLPPTDTKSLIASQLPTEKKPIVTQLKDNLVTSYQEFINKNAPFDIIQKQTGIDTGVKASNINRISGSVDYQLGKAQTNLNGEEIGKSLADIWNKDIPSEDIMDYAFNRHNIQRAGLDKPVFGDTVQPQMSKAKVAEYEARYPGIKETGDEIVQYMSNLLDVSKSAGLVSEDLANTLRQMYPNYVPTYRAKEITKALGNNGQYVANVIKKAKGGESTLLPLDQQMAIMTNKVFRAARKNELMNSLDEAFQTNPEGIKKYIKGITDVAEDTPKNLLEVGQGLEKELVKEGDSYLVTYYKDGVPKQMKVNENIYNAMTELDFGIVDDVLGAIKKGATEPFKQLITQKNPFFAIRNIMRDVPTALVYSGNPVKFVQSIPEAITQIKNNGDLWKQYQALGGTRSGLFNYEKGADLGLKKSLGKKIGEVIEAPGGFTETVPRFAEYVRSIKAGDSPALALMKSAELTTDFARHGRAGKKIDAVIPYFNAGLQGMDKFAREMYKNPLKTMAKAGVVITAPTMILDQINKDNKAYNEMSARERNMYYHIPIPNSEQLIRIPRSRETGVIFGNVFEWLSRASRGQEVTPDEIKSSVVENFTPAGFDSAIWRPASNFIDIWTGKDPDAKNYFGAKIVPESLQKYSPSMQFDEKTSSLSKSLGAYLDVSPKALDYLFDSYLGIAADVGIPLMTDNKQKALAPIKNMFIADPVFKSDTLNKFYDRLEDLRAKGNDLNKQYDIPSKVVNPYEEQANRLAKVSKRISEINKEIKSTKDEDKVRELRKALNELAKKGEQLFNEEELQSKLNTLLGKLK